MSGITDLPARLAELLSGERVVRMTMITALIGRLSKFGQHVWSPWDPPSAEDLHVLSSRWPLPADYVELAGVGGGEIGGTSGKLALFEPHDVLAFNDPNDEGLPGLEALVMIGNDSGGYWYAYSPRENAGHPAWSLYLISMSGGTETDMLFAAETLTKLIERILDGESPVDDRYEPAID